MVRKKRVEAEYELEWILALEEYYWKHRARIEWLWGRDRNINFFHCKASAQRNKNAIRSLEDSKGKQTVDEGFIIKAEEVKEALFAMGPNKASAQTVSCSLFSKELGLG